MSQTSCSVGKASLLMSLVSQIPLPLLPIASLPLLTLSTLPELSGQHPPLVKVHVYTFLMLWRLRISFKVDGKSFSLPPWLDHLTDTPILVLALFMGVAIWCVKDFWKVGRRLNERKCIGELDYPFYPLPFVLTFPCTPQTSCLLFTPPGV